MPSHIFMMVQGSSFTSRNGYWLLMLETFFFCWIQRNMLQSANQADSGRGASATTLQSHLITKPVKTLQFGLVAFISKSSTTTISSIKKLAPSCLGYVKSNFGICLFLFFFHFIYIIRERMVKTALAMA